MAHNISKNTHTLKACSRLFIVLLYLQVNYQYYRGPGLEFTFSLHTEDGEETVHGMKLSRFGVQETTNDGKANFKIRPPAVGVYKLAVYAREVQQGESTNRMYCAVVEYKVRSGFKYIQVQTRNPATHN